MKIRFLPFIFTIYAILLVIASCQSQSSPNDTDCKPSSYFDLDNPFLEEVALVTCTSGATVKPFSTGDLVIVPIGGVHALYLHSRSDWKFPSGLQGIDTSFVEVFAGGCPIELSCLVEANEKGFPSNTNRIQTTLSRLDAQTLKIEFELPTDAPNQVMVRISFCRVWQSEDYCLSENDLGGNVGAELTYVFRYETIEHIQSLPPGVECYC